MKFVIKDNNCDKLLNYLKKKLWLISFIFDLALPEWLEQDFISYIYIYIYLCIYQSYLIIPSFSIYLSIY